MSLVSKNKQQRPATSAPEKQTSPRQPRQKRRGLTALAIIILGLLLLVGLLPTIIAHTSLMTFFVRRAAMLDGPITFHSASIGWFSSTSISGIEIRDAQGETVLEADSLTCDRSLLKLLFNSSNIGVLRIEKPRLSAKLARDGSNVESVLARWLNGQGSSSKGVDLSVEVVDGEATIVDQETQQSWHVTDLQFALDMSRRLVWPTRMEGVATVDDRGHPCGLALKSHLKASEMPPTDPAAWCGLAGTDGDLSLQTTALPLAMFQRLTARGMPGLKLDGKLGSNLEAQWTGPANVKLDGSLNGSDLCIESPSLGRDVVRLEKVQAVCKAARQDKQLTVEEAKVECEVGNLAATGHVDLDERGLEAPAALLRQRDCSVRGTLDLARLARLLPGTLRVRPGMEITSGLVQLTVRTTSPAAGSAVNPAPAALAWQARLETSRLTAVDRGRQISWDKPVLIDAAIHQTDQGPVFDNLRCQSDFLSIDGSGTPDRFTASVTLNLRQLTDDLGRFVDLSGLVLSGDGNGKLQWSCNAASDFDAGGQLELRNFQLGIPQRQPWAEDSLTLVLGAKGHADFIALTRLDEAVLQLRSGAPGVPSDGSRVAEQIEVRLFQPIADLSAHTLWSLALQMQGRLDRWSQRLAPLATAQGLRLAGNYQVSGQVAWSADSLSFSQTKINATQLAVAGTTWNWSDPAIELDVAGRIDLASSRLQLEAANLVASTISLGAKDLVCSMPGNGPVQIDGTVIYQWEKVNSMLQPYTGASIQFFGTGTSPIAYRGASPSAQAEASVAVPFTGANVYGLQVGPGELKVHLANGVLSADPLEVTCNQGRVAVQPELRMDRQPMEFHLSAGTIARQIQLDQAACRSALKYVVPVLASVTQSQGQFSIQLDGCRIPIGDLNRAEIAGRIIVHSATMNAGPLVEQLASLVAASPSLVHIEPESVILFRMTGGRIYHQGLALQFPDVTMRTYGSVGLDDSLKLMVETSVPLTWLPSNAMTDAIKKRKLQIPVGGTLQSPRLDLGELARVKNQFLSNLGVLQSELGSELNRLIQPQK
ncbi:MAG: hypothetical protein ACLP9L_39520 [Thermoguttaceae bacterium]